jgi:hypothetical protein
LTMRKLYLVPIIHTRSDMGSISPVLSAISIKAYGEELWTTHQQTVVKFWDGISLFFKSLDVRDFKIYQDGLIIEGADGIRIIDEGARLGSVNYKIIADLLQRGAVLVKTEDINLVQKEYAYIKNMTSAKSAREIKSAATKYKLIQNQLLLNRDKFIAGTITNTLKNDETGILFIGAYHDIISKLPSDILITQVKQVSMVSEYHRTLSNLNSQNRERFQYLAEYLASPVSAIAANSH